MTDETQNSGATTESNPDDSGATESNLREIEPRVSAPDLELYELQGCPYCAKVRRALSDLKLEYESHSVPRSRRDRAAVYEVSGQYQVPVLVDNTKGIEGMPESDDIVTYLYEQYGAGQEPPPSGVVARILAKLF